MRVLLAATVATGIAVVGCSDQRILITPIQPIAPVGRGAASGFAPPAASGSVPTATVAPTVADAVAPAALIAAGPKGLAAGARGPAVTALERRLLALRFNPGPADGAYDGQLTMAVMAFQKQQDLPRTGRADPTMLARLAGAGLGTPVVAAGEATRVEVDLRRQIAQFWKDGRLLRVLAVSTGSGAHYCVPKDRGGGCDTAITPGGSFRADRKIADVRVSALGTLYDPVYFYGGIAIHGSPSIPATPASHGCVRVPMWESGWVYDTVTVGDPVYVVGGQAVPLPLGAAAPAVAPDEVNAPPAAADEAPAAGADLQASGSPNGSSAGADTGRARPGAG